VAAVVAALVEASDLLLVLLETKQNVACIDSVASRFMHWPFRFSAASPHLSQ
jgi:hypothetical protein